MIYHFQFSIDGRIWHWKTRFVQQCLFWRNPRILACKHSCIGPVNLVATNLLDQAGFQQLTFAHKDGMSAFIKFVT